MDNVREIMSNSCKQSQKSAILIIISNYIPAYKSGGPIRSIANIVEHLSAFFDFYILTRDRDLHDKKPFPNISLTDWNNVENAKVKYVRDSTFNPFKLNDLFKTFDYKILYLNSFFSFKFSILPLIIHKFVLRKKSSIILAPRGQFSVGALKTKGIFKYAFIAFARLFHIYDNIIWHASNKDEADEIEKMFKNNLTIKIASNLIPKENHSDVLSNISFKTKTIGYLRIVYLSGIVPKKNLHYALKILSRIKQPVQIEFDIYGPVKNEQYFAKCKKLINAMTAGVKVQYKGSIPNYNVREILSNYHMFLFPTLGENFGHVIFEALLSSCPPLISDTTPWSDIHHSKAGWVYDLKCSENFLRQIVDCALFDTVTQKEFSDNARQYAQNYINNFSNIIKSNYMMFNNTLQQKNNLIKHDSEKTVDEPKKVLFYDPISRSGGGKAYIMNVIPKINRSAQFEYHFYINRCFENQKELRNPYVQVHYSPKGTEQGGLKSFMKRYFFTKKEIDKIKPDVVVFMNQIPTRFKVPTILFLRNALYFIKKNKNYFGPFSLKDRIRCTILKKVTLNSIRKSDLVLTSSEAFSKTVMPYLSDAKSKLAVAAFGHNQNTLSNETRVPFSNSDNEINIVCLQYNFYKGIETAVKAMNDLLPKCNKIKLIITDNLETHSDIRARMLWHEISANNLRDHIVTTGLLKQDELKNIYNKADIFIFPSFIESFGHGILEAMANGVPCILSDIEVFREIASDAALYFKPGNKEELCNCITRLINNVDESKKMVQRGIERVKLFTWEKHITILEQILSSVLKSNETTIPESKNRQNRTSRLSIPSM